MTRLRTTREVAVELAVSTDWVLDRCRAGAAHFDTGRGFRFTKEHITGLIALMERGRRVDQAVIMLSARAS